MILMDQDSKHNISDALLMLTLDEAAQLEGALCDLRSSKVGLSHSHVNNSSYSKELTVMLYDPKDDPTSYGLHTDTIELVTRDNRFIED